jgi:hypothetical protein
MEISLPHAVATFVRAENSGDADALLECFAPYATVRDDDQYLEGVQAIRAWRARMKQVLRHTLTPLEYDSSDGRATLKAEVSGNFAGSPMTTKMHFTFAGDRIGSLQIRSP